MYHILDSIILKIKKPKNINKEALELTTLLLTVFLNDGKLNKLLIFSFHRIHEDLF